MPFVCRPLHLYTAEQVFSVPQTFACSFVGFLLLLTVAFDNSDVS